MITSVTANMPNFKSVSFRDGLNVILADMAEGATDKDSRNGVGKTTLLEIIHYCLGGSDNKKSCPLRKSEDLIGEGWEFTVGLTLPVGPVTITRGLAKPKEIYVSGATVPRTLDPQPDNQGRWLLSTAALNLWLGQELFSLPIEKPSKFAPSYRSLISYFARREFDIKPYEFMAKQTAWSRNVHSAYLLGLNWEPASELQVLKERKDLLKKVTKGIREGIIRGPQGRVSEMESKCVRLDQDIDALKRQLKDFKVHPDYRQVEEQATALTGELQRLRREGYRLRNTLRHYEDSLSSEIEPAKGSVLALYESAQVELPELITKSINEVEQFHRQVIQNRTEFLRDECNSLRTKIVVNEQKEARVGQERAQALSIIDSYHALDEYNQLHERLANLRHERAALADAIKQRREIDQGRDEIEVEKQQIIIKGKRDHAEREEVRAKAIALFNENSRALYAEGAEGKLEIDFKDGGFIYNIDIQGAGSTGIEAMKMFCFDLMLAQLWSQKDINPGFLYHDSRLFDGVDDRQKAAAIRLASQQAEKFGFRYICAFNTNDLPAPDLLGDLYLNDTVRLRLTDLGPEGKLLGRAF